jgi:hypothetical protein
LKTDFVYNHSPSILLYNNKMNKSKIQKNNDFHFFAVHNS